MVDELGNVGAYLNAESAIGLNYTFKISLNCYQKY
jgi:hypothetical protein